MLHGVCGAFVHEGGKNAELLLRRSALSCKAKGAQIKRAALACGYYWWDQVGASMLWRWR